MNPKISIIVPCYNVEDYIKDCIASILNQTYSNWELILVDDGSIDFTPGICDQFAKIDTRIKTIHKKNGGLVSSRNVGYNSATGDWFFFLDGDDWVDKEMLEKCVKQIKNTPDIDVIFWKIVVELNGKQVYNKWNWPCSSYTELYEGNSCHDLAIKTFEYSYGIASPVIRLVNMKFARQFGIQHDDRTVQGCEGLIFAIRSFYYARRVLFINEFFYHYRYNPSSISKSVDEANIKYEIDCFKVIEEDISKFDSKEIFKNALYLKVVYVIIAMAMNSYFNPLNSDNIYQKCKKFKHAIYSYELYSTAISQVSLLSVDKQRRIALLFIKYKLYFMLDIIGRLKQFMVHRGKFDY